LDAVSEKAEQSDVGVVRQAGAALDKVRGAVGLDRIPTISPIPDWESEHPDQPMWQSDREKLRRHQVDKGIIDPTGPEEQQKAAEVPAIKVYFRRGCPYSRAALELLKQRELAFAEFDYTDDPSLHGWVKMVTGCKTSPQVLVHDQPIGGYDQLRELDLSGELQRLIDAGPVTEDDDEPAAQEPESEAQELSVDELATRIAEGQRVDLLDVRRPDEWQTGVIEGAVRIELSELETRCDELDADTVWVVYCLSGGRSARAQALLQRRDFAQVVNLRGGIAAWKAGGHAVHDPSKSSEPVGASEAPKPKIKKLPVLQQHPERSPFEAEAMAILQAGDSVVDTTVLTGEALQARVLEVLDEVRPMVQADGGDIRLLDIGSDIVSVELTGNCIGCPSSQATLRQGIERRLMERIPQIKGIRSPQLDPSG